MCKRHVSLIYSGKHFMFSWVKTQFSALITFHHWCLFIFLTNPFMYCTRFNGRFCFCQTLWDALCQIFYLRTDSQFMKSLTLIKTIVSALNAILHWHHFSLLIFCRCLSHLLNPPSLPDVHRPLQTEHGLLPERLQRGHVRIGGAPGHFGERPVQVRPEWTQQLPELGERSGLADHRLCPGSELPQEEDNRHAAVSSVLRYRRRQGHLYCTNTDSKGHWECLSLQERACVKRFLFVTQDGCQWCHKDHKLTTGQSEGHQFNPSKLSLFFNFIIVNASCKGSSLPLVLLFYITVGIFLWGSRLNQLFVLFHLK